MKENSATQLTGELMLFAADIPECTNSSCSGNGECIEKTGGGTVCVCKAGYTSSDCSTGKAYRVQETEGNRMNRWNWE